LKGKPFTKDKANFVPITDFLELAKASPAKIRLAYERNHGIKEKVY